VTFCSGDCGGRPGKRDLARIGTSWRGGVRTALNLHLLLAAVRALPPDDLFGQCAFLPRSAPQTDGLNLVLSVSLNNVVPESKRGQRIGHKLPSSGSVAWSTMMSHVAARFERNRSAGRGATCAPHAPGTGTSACRHADEELSQVYRLAFSICSACFSEVSVSLVPLIMRAISRVRSAASSSLTEVVVLPVVSRFSIR